MSWLNLLWQIPVSILAVVMLVWSVGAFLMVIWLAIKHLFDPENMPGPME